MIATRERFEDVCKIRVGSAADDGLRVGAEGRLSGWRPDGWTTAALGAVPRVAFWCDDSGRAVLVRERGVVHRERDGDWRAMPSGTRWPLRAVWGASDRDIIGVGDGGVIVHFDGSAWTRQTAVAVGSLRGVWVGADGAAVAVGVEGDALHRADGHWSPRQTGTHYDLRAVWGRSASDVFAVGDGGVVIHFDGTRWRRESIDTDAGLISVWGKGPDFVVALDHDGFVWQRKSGTQHDESVPAEDTGRSNSATALQLLEAEMPLVSLDGTLVAYEESADGHPAPALYVVDVRSGQRRGPVPPASAFAATDAGGHLDERSWTLQQLRLRAWEPLPAFDISEEADVVSDAVGDGVRVHYRAPTFEVWRGRQRLLRRSFADLVRPQKNIVPCPKPRTDLSRVWGDGKVGVAVAEVAHHLVPDGCDAIRTKYVLSFKR